MSDIIGGLGSVAEGSLFSRALEPDSGARDAHPDQPEECLNCGTPLTGAYCHACGQKGHLHRTIGAFLHELVHGALHFEGKFWRTLPMLVFKPGHLTRRYIEGARARFVSPMALFLFGVFLMFAVFQVLGITAPSDLGRGQVMEDSLRDAREAAQTELAQIEEQLSAQDLSEEGRAEREERAALLRAFLSESPLPSRTLVESFSIGSRDGASGEGAGEPGNGARENVVIPLEEGGAKMTMNATGIDWIDEIILEKWRDNPGLMLYKLQANAYKFSWLLIPISIPFVWLLFFWKRRFKAYDHAIFVTYSLSFVTLLFIAGSVLLAAGVHPALIVLPTILIPPIHLYKQLRHTYELSRWGAFWRLNVLSLFIWIAIMLFIQLLLMLGAF